MKKRVRRPRTAEEKERQRVAAELKRRKMGCLPRQVWLDRTASKGEAPWLAQGISWSTWYKRRAAELKRPIVDQVLAAVAKDERFLPLWRKAFEAMAKMIPSGEGPMSCDELARAIARSRACAHRITRRFEHAGYVVRQNQPGPSGTRFQLKLPTAAERKRSLVRADRWVRDDENRIDPHRNRPTVDRHAAAVRAKVEELWARTFGLPDHALASEQALTSDLVEAEAWARLRHEALKRRMRSGGSLPVIVRA